MRTAQLFFFELELAAGLVLVEKRPQVARGIEQAHPLLVVKCHRETPQPVNTDAAFFSDPEFELPAAAPCLALFEFRHARPKFLILWFRHSPSLKEREMIEHAHLLFQPCPFAQGVKIRAATREEPHRLFLSRRV